MAFALNGSPYYQFLQKPIKSDQLLPLFNKNKAIVDGLISADEFDVAQSIIIQHGIPTHVDYTSDIFNNLLTQLNHTMQLQNGVELTVADIKPMLNFTDILKTLILLIKSGTEHQIKNSVVLLDDKMASIVREFEKSFNGKLEHVASTIRYAKSLPEKSPGIEGASAPKNRQQAIECDLKLFDKLVIDNPSNLDNDLLNSFRDIHRIIFFWNLRCAKSNGLCERHYFNLEKLSKMDQQEKVKQLYELIFYSIPDKNPEQCTPDAAALKNNPTQARYLISKGVNTFKIARTDVGTQGETTKQDIEQLLQLFASCHSTIQKH